MLGIHMSLIWFRLRLPWRLTRRRRSVLPVSEHLRRDLNLPPCDPPRHWRDLLP